MSTNISNTFDEEDNIKINTLNVSDFSEINSNENDTYLKTVFLKNININLILIILFVGFFILEFFIRQPLFDYSLTFEEKWQKQASNSTIFFFQVITKVGGEYLMAAPVACVFCFFPMIKSSFFIAGLIFVLHFHSLMKIWYGNVRPYWVKESLFRKICDGGFGNPSGHSISSVYLYLTLFIYIRETKHMEKKYLFQIILFLMFITFIILIILSRLILGIHSINQVIYGSVLGLFTTLMVVYIFKLHQMPIGFYKRLFKEKILIFCISGILIILELFSILSSLSFNTNFDIEKYEEILSRLCKDLPKFRKFNLDGLFGAFVILALLGMYLGQVVFWYLIDNYYKKNNNRSEKIEFILNPSDKANNSFDSEDVEENINYKVDKLINNWNRNRTFLFCSIGKICKLIFILNLCCSPVILFITVSKEANIVLIFIFKFGIPFFSILFLVFSFGFYYIIKIFCGEKEELLRRVKKKNNNKKI